MIAVALKGLAGRKVRALLTALAVVIGISMVSGTYILTDTMQKSFDGLFTATYDETDAVISGKEIVKGTTTGSAKIPAALLTKVQALDEVGAAGGVVSPDQDSAADIIGPDGKPVARESVAGSYDAAHAEFSPLKLKSGSWPKGPQQVVDRRRHRRQAALRARRHRQDLDVRREALLRADRHREVRRRRLARVREHRGLGPEDRPDAAAPRGQLRLDLHLGRQGHLVEELVRAVAPLVPGNLQVKDSVKQAKDDAEELNSSMSILKYFLLGFGGDRAAGRRVRDLQHAVDHRRPADAGVRDAADARRLAQAGHALRRGGGPVIGLLASVIGLIAGIGLAKGMVALFSAMGIELPDAATVIAPRTIVLSIVSAP